MAGIRSVLDAGRSSPLAEPDAKSEIESPLAAPSTLPAGDGGREGMPLRRLGRAVLRALRALALPLLHRFEWRVRTAVTKTGLIDATARLESSLATCEANITALAAALQEPLQQLQETRGAILQSQELSRLEFEVLQASLDSISDRLAASEAGQARVEDHLAARSAIEDRLGGRLDEMWHGLNEMWQGLSARADMILKRGVLPLGDVFLVRTPFGWLFMPSSDPKLLMHLYESGGVLEPGTTAVIEGLLKPGDAVVDAGSHIGLITLPAARCVGERGQVIAVEPIPKLAGLLRQSMLLNDLNKSVVVHECAAGETAARASFNVGSVLGHSSFLPLDEPSERIDVDVQPLDELAPAGAPIKLVKLDVEGSELVAWRGMHRIIGDNPGLAVIVEYGPSHLDRTNVAIEDWIGELTAPGFIPYEIDESTGICRTLRSEGLDRVFSMNLLLLRDAPERYPGLRFA
jgi:FkbM family methyltransferase